MAATHGMVKAPNKRVRLSITNGLVTIQICIVFPNYNKESNYWFECILVLHIFPVVLSIFLINKGFLTLSKINK